MDIKKFIGTKTGVSSIQIQAVLELSESGATVPFIARYRKEATGNLDEIQIEQILNSGKEFSQIITRKKTILKTIEELGKLDNNLLEKINDCYDLERLEDYFLPYKKKRVTKAEKARNAGLSGLAKLIMKQDNGDPVWMAEKFVQKDYESAEMALEGAKYIMAEWINENIIVRDKLRQSFYEYGVVKTKKVKNSEDEKQRYLDFYDYSQSIKKCPSYRLLAILRGENEKILNVKISPNTDYTINWLERFFVKNSNSCSQIVKSVIQDAYKRLLQPQLETETRKHYKKLADEKSLETFSKNLRKILLAPPIGEKRILAIDPGFRTGCKIVCLDNTGNLLHNETVYPHAPKNEKSKAASKVSQLVEMYKIEAIAIGDGTAGRESERWIRHIKFRRDIQVFIVREDGASIYSASKIAREEFPNYDITVRGAVSIGRRLSDPLAELVKIDPKSLGVGQYQHDVNQTKLKETLGFVVESVVNQVGVNLNTASKHLLAFVSGVGEKTAESIVNYRESNGVFGSRDELKKVPGLGAKTYEQSVGFLRVKNEEKPLDNSGVHPEQYNLVKKIAKKNDISVGNLIGNEEVLNQVLADDNFKKEIGVFTLTDLIAELKRPGLDPRRTAKIFEFTAGIHSIEDLSVGMLVNGIITNVTDFGAFVNIGIKENGLIHKTQLAEEYVNSPTDIVSVDDQVKVRIVQIDIERKRIGLSLIIK